MTRLNLIAKQQVQRCRAHCETPGENGVYELINADGFEIATARGSRDASTEFDAGGGCWIVAEIDSGYAPFFPVDQAKEQAARPPQIKRRPHRGPMASGRPAGSRKAQPPA